MIIFILFSFLCDITKSNVEHINLQKTFYNNQAPYTPTRYPKSCYKLKNWIVLTRNTDTVTPKESFLNSQTFTLVVSSKNLSSNNYQTIFLNAYC